MRILILSYGQYPDGGAFINRILGYAKGLIELGNEVKVLLLSKQINEEKIKSYPFLDYSLFNGNHNHKNKFLKLFSYININRNVSNHIKKYSYDIAYLYGMTFPFAHRIAKISKSNSLKIVNEQTEYPFVISNRSIFRKIYMKYFIYNIHRNFNGLVVISDQLKSYYDTITKGKIPIKKVNMFIDPNRFEKGNNKFFDFEYIAYAGIMYGTKDGVADLIKAFKIVHDRFPRYKLVLLGDNTDKDRMKTINKAITTDIKDSIVFTGRVDRSMMPSYLSNAKLLVLARPKTKQAEAGFPTKLGEYLATGRPVIITDVGEIKRFLTDQQNAFIAKNNSQKVFAAKMMEALRDIEKANKIGENGKSLVFNEFNFLVQSKNLEDFFKEIIGNG